LMLRVSCVIACICVSVASATTPLTPAEMQKLMGFGINLGNRIDLYQQPARPVLEKYFDAYAAKGFTNVRIPVCWDMHTDETAPYAINSTFMDLVESAVDWSMSRGMVTVLNTHHEKWLDNPSAFATKLPRLEAMWTQIAERFKDKNQTLLFEIFNEPHLMTAADLNTMNSAILPIIRATNPSRVVILMGLKFGNPSWHLQNPDGLTIPDDKQIMVEIHNYDPFKYAGAKPSQKTWGSDKDKAALTEWVDGIDTWAAKKGVKLYYGEFGCSNTQTHATGRDAWFSAHYAAIQSKGWAASVWNDGQGHLIYDYNDGTWVQDILDDLGHGGPTPPPSPSPPTPTPPSPPPSPSPPAPTPPGACAACGYHCDGDCSTCSKCSDPKAKPFCSSSATNCLKHCGGSMWCGS